MAARAADVTSNDETTVPASLDEIRYEIALANRMLAHEGVLDAFGHVSMRHPDDAGRYLLSRSQAPELVEPSNILEFDLDSEGTAPTQTRLHTYYRQRNAGYLVSSSMRSCVSVTR